MLMKLSRRNFLQRSVYLSAATALPLPTLSYVLKASKVMTVGGSIKASHMGMSLIHEHVLVDFIGAEKISFDRWDRVQVVKKVLPYLKEIKGLGIKTLVECTPAYLGRDVHLLEELSEQSELNIITNTGYYGARNNQHLPQHAFTENAEQLADRWIKEFENGIDGSSIKPGFMKIGVDNGPLSDMHRKLVRAAAITHKATGLTIASHTGPALPAFEEMEILNEEGIALNAFIWVHAQHEEDSQKHVEAAQQGAWVSLDGLSESSVERYTEILKLLKANKLLDKVLLSHDAGWYRPGEVEGGQFRAYTDIFEFMLPAMRENGFSEKEIRTIFVSNPSKAFTISKRLV
ncbi:phosphotriesterase-related protein [Catalinimonas alkaloidigena]|uniref:phosphotriesterase family protein n=1 Tax=Catalinimonas alkaloidigena TaxID=1075417 RepID=UPI0024074023|nr:phosphotriesterase [Catalinimonas alkaloidigena]MDF9797443.1 phosphotriesterase-related protein [Catalinimonas alkaloidigena]